MALWSIGPRHTTALSSGTKKSIDIAFTPWASGGMIDWSMTTGGWEIPSILGIENPQMSPSMTPTV